MSSELRARERESDSIERQTLCWFLTVSWDLSPTLKYRITPAIYLKMGLVCTWRSTVFEKTEFSQKAQITLVPSCLFSVLVETEFSVHLWRNLGVHLIPRKEWRPTDLSEVFAGGKILQSWVKSSAPEERSHYSEKDFCTASGGEQHGSREAVGVCVNELCAVSPVGYEEQRRSDSCLMTV